MTYAPAHYHLSIDGVRCCSDGVLADDGVPATWRTLRLARRQGVLAIHRCHCSNTLSEYV